MLSRAELGKASTEAPTAQLLADDDAVAEDAVGKSVEGDDAAALLRDVDEISQLIIDKVGLDS